MAFWRTKKFKELNEHWNGILKNSGFVDSEVETKGGMSLKQRSTNAYRQASSLERDSRLEYYLYVGHKAQNTHFDNALEELILKMHAGGSLIKEIADEIKNRNDSLDRRTIRFIIRRWQMRWGIRRWNHRQVGLKKKNTR
jgi:hypothetical protein